MRIPRRPALAAAALAALLALATAPHARAQGPAAPLASDAAWRGEYFNNMTLSGSPSLVRQDERIDFTWGSGSPGAPIASDRFSVRWSRYLELPAGKYRFDATSDDGVRVIVDGTRIIDRWYSHAAESYGAEITLGAGHHLVQVEYFEAFGDARIAASWSAVAETPLGYRAELYGNRALSGAPLVTRDDSAIDFDWGIASPAPGVVPADDFSVRWTRQVAFAPGLYRFVATSDDGVRVWVNGHLLIDAWYDQGATQHAGTIWVPASAEVRMEYYDHVGAAVAKLRWERADGGQPSPGARVHVVKQGETLYRIAAMYGTTVAAIMAANGLPSADKIYAGQTLTIPGGGPTPPPQGADVVVDEADAGFRRGGSATGWQAAAFGYRGRSIWTLNNRVEQPSYNWARWYPTLAAGRYEVSVFVPSRNANTTHATYWVAHADGFASRVVSQLPISDGWVSLGTYRFAGTGDEYVSLNDITGEPALSRRIGFDAVRWSRR